jgi:integrase
MNNHMGAVSKFSNWVHGRHPHARHDKLEFSTLRFKVDKRPDEQRAAFTVPEVKRILEDERLLGFRAHKPEKFWLPYIAAYSAMRVEEIAQLDPTTDFVEDGDVWLFDVNDANGKQLKNKTSVRKVPIHPHPALIKLGLLTYVEEMRQRGARSLFPNVKAAEGRLAKNAAKTVNRFIRLQVGIEKSLHSFRHTVATLLKQMRVDEALAAPVLGHAHGGITYTRYGKDHLPKVLYDEVVIKIAYGLAIERKD